MQKTLSQNFWNAALVTLSVVMGYCVAPAPYDLSTLLCAVAGTALCSASSLSLNQVYWRGCATACVYSWCGINAPCFMAGFFTALPPSLPPPWNAYIHVQEWLETPYDSQMTRTLLTGLLLINRNTGTVSLINIVVMNVLWLYNSLSIVSQAVDSPRTSAHMTSQSIISAHSMAWFITIFLIPSSIGCACVLEYQTFSSTHTAQSYYPMWKSLIGLR